MKEMTLSCPVATRSSGDKILLAHGSGGAYTADLIENIFLPAFGKISPHLHDGALFSVGEKKLALTTDSYVVQPLFFPGGNIGDLAVNGTVNDLAMCGATPLLLTAAFILEEGFPMNDLIAIVDSMKISAERVGVRFAAGDTKVVEKSRGDGLYINTTGIGIVERGAIDPCAIAPGDIILIDGDIGRHGIAVLSKREGLEFETELKSDTRELFSSVQALLKEEVAIHCLRDLTRGGLATALVELAESREVTMKIDETAIAVDETVRGACEFLGLDPLYVACEGRMLLIIPPEEKEKALTILARLGSSPSVIGEVTGKTPPQVIAKTFMGTERVVDRLPGEQLPRIC